MVVEMGIDGLGTLLVVVEFAAGTVGREVVVASTVDDDVIGCDGGGGKVVFLMAVVCTELAVVMTVGSRLSLSVVAMAVDVSVLPFMNSIDWECQSVRVREEVGSGKWPDGH